MRAIHVSLALVALLAVYTPRAEASDFTVLGSHSLHYTSPGSRTITVRNEVLTDSFYVWASVTTGSSHFSVSPTIHRFHIGDSTTTFTITFSTQTHDTSSGTLLVYSLHQSDTIRLLGVDTTGLLTDFTVTPASAYFIVNSGADTVQRSFTIHPYFDSAMHFRASLVGRGWGLGDTTVTVDTFTTFGSNQSLTLTYWSHGVAHETGRLIVAADWPVSQVDTFYLYANDSNYIHSIQNVTISYASFDTTVYGDTTCETVYIANHNPEAVQLTSYTLTENGARSQTWYLGGLTVPHTLAAGDSVAVTLCFGGYGSAEVRLNLNLSDSALNYGSQSRTFTSVVVPCMTASRDSVYLNDIPVGAYSEFSVRYHFNKALSLSQLRTDSSGVVSIVSPTLPISVTKGESVTVTYRVQPSSVGAFSRNIEVGGSYYCGESIEIVGRGVASGADTVNMFSPEQETLTFQTASDTATHTFTFRNNSGSTIRVTNVSLAQGSHFAITGLHPHATPDTLANLGMLGVDLLFQGDTNGVYDDSLTIVTEGMLQALTFHLHATKNALSVTAIDPNPIALNIAPNPARGPVTIDVKGATTAEIEVFDLLGHRIAESRGSANWRWSTNELPAGAYIVRATGTHHGAPFAVSERIVISK